MWTRLWNGLLEFKGFIVILSFLLLSCSEQNPVFSELGLSALAPKVNETKIKIVKEYFETTFAISGECDKRIETLLIKIANEDWKTPSELGIGGDHSCTEDGSYSLTAKADVYTFEDNTDYKDITVSIKGENKFGSSGISDEVLLEYKESNNDLLKADLLVVAQSKDTINITMSHDDFRITNMELWRKQGRHSLDCVNKPSWTSTIMLTSTSNNSKTHSDTGLASGTDYTYVVCSYSDDLRVSTSNIEVEITKLEVEHFKLTSQSLWGEYAVNNNEIDYYESSTLSTACNASTATKLSDCVHLAELKKITVNADGFSSCSEVTFKDSLGLFHWSCEDSGSLVFKAQGFKENISLVNAIDMQTTDWRSNSFEVKKGDIQVSSSEENWWNNSIDLISGDGQQLTQPNTVYIYNGGEGPQSVGDIEIGANSVSVVVNSDTSIGKTDSDYALKANGYNFLWIEGGFANANSGSTNNGVEIINTNFINLRNIKSFKNAKYGVSLSGVKFASLNNIDSSFNKYGVGIYNSEAINLQKVKVTNNTQSGVNLLTGSSLTDISINNLISSNNKTYGLLNNTNLNGHNFFTNITSINNNNGLVFNKKSAGSKYIYNTYINNNDEYGMIFGELGGSTDEENNYFSYLSLLNNGTQGLSLRKLAVTTTDFKGDIIFENNISNCSDGGGSVACPTPHPITTIYTSALVGKQNRTTTAPPSKRTEFDFTNFHNIWTKNELLSFPAPIYIDDCNSGFCRTFDTSFKTSITDNYNAYYNNPDSGRLSFISNTTCPDSVTDNTDRAQYNYFGIPAQKFLLFAYEINTDFVGNNNGVCEDYERCVWTPNLGSYQGHGELDYNATCNGPSLSNVKLIAYPFNGR